MVTRANRHTRRAIAANNRPPSRAKTKLMIKQGLELAYKDQAELTEKERMHLQTALTLAPVFGIPVPLG